jgi:large subunit ribosomal protein L6
MREDIKTEIELKEGVTASLDNSLISIKGPKGEVKRDFLHPKVKLSLDGKKVVLESIKSSKREKMIVGSFSAHIKNIISGVLEPHIYKLKICSGHFPMNVSVSGKDFVIKNFLGESVPRKLKLIDGADVKVDGTEIIVTSANKEIAGQTAASIESLCRITNRDLRIFQDGVYIIHKSGKDM